MTADARRLTADRDGCESHVNETGDLRRFADRSFDLVHSTLPSESRVGRTVTMAYGSTAARSITRSG